VEGYTLAVIRKIKEYRTTKFSPEVIFAARDLLIEQTGRKSPESTYENLNIDLPDGSQWYLDDRSGWAGFYRGDVEYARIEQSYGTYSLSVTFRGNSSVEAKSNTRGEVESIFALFEAARPLSRFPPFIPPTIFIGHGRSSAWEQLRDHLRDLHRFEVQYFESGTRLDAVSQMSCRSSNLTQQSHSSFTLPRTRPRTAPCVHEKTSYMRLAYSTQSLA